MKKLISVLLVLSLALGVFSACGSKDNAEIDPVEGETSSDQVDPPKEDSAKNEEKNTTENEEEVAKVDLPNPEVTIELESGNKIVLELLPEFAPNTVNNFVTLANDGFYDGVIFHRVVPGFVIQGGDPDGNGTGGPDYSIPGEFISNGFDQNRLSHTRGVISMARSGHPDSAGSQFFIVVDDAAIPSLDGQYAGFGYVKEGMEYVDEIVSTETVPGTEMPDQPVVIKTITVDTKGIENWPEPNKA